VKYYAIISILLISLLITSCKKEETYTSNYDYGYSYFPDDSGCYVIYKVDSVLYNDFDRSMKYTTIYLKEKIGAQFLDNMGRTAKKILRYYSDTISTDITSTVWDQYNANYIVKTPIVVERVEDNLRYIKMVFPNEINKKWLGNKYITIPPPFVLDSTNYYLNDWKFTIKNRDKFFSDGISTFDSSLLISQIQDSSAITKTYSVERYARNVGLIYKEMWMVSTQDSVKIRLQLPWEQRADKGFIIRQYAIAYGKE
jgi:uncharacterized lipoprotein YehR (DUF1307 family)